VCVCVCVYLHQRVFVIPFSASVSVCRNTPRGAVEGSRGNKEIAEEIPRHFGLAASFIAGRERHTRKAQKDTKRHKKIQQRYKKETRQIQQRYKKTEERGSKAGNGQFAAFQVKKMESAISTIVKVYMKSSKGKGSLGDKDFQKLVKSQLSNIMMGTENSEAIKEMRKGLDANQDNKVSFEEFMQLMGYLANALSQQRTLGKEAVQEEEQEAAP
uniref:EF-hand domain-containing protein n=1 Tax=Scleropages formosus TaxID=113540 RepID=A0A8C9V1P4_SCLFO